MTVKELKEILSNYEDKQQVAITVIDSEDTFLLTDIREKQQSTLNALELVTFLPPSYIITEK